MAVRRARTWRRSAYKAHARRRMPAPVSPTRSATPSPDAASVCRPSVWDSPAARRGIALRVRVAVWRATSAMTPFRRRPDRHARTTATAGRRGAARARANENPVKFLADSEPRQGAALGEWGRCVGADIDRVAARIRSLNTLLTKHRARGAEPTPTFSPTHLLSVPLESVAEGSRGYETTCQSDRSVHGHGVSHGLARDGQRVRRPFGLVGPRGRPRAAASDGGTSHRC
jgi:hypothetical protein